MQRIIDNLEEMVIVAILGTMTIVTFSQVIARYFFNSGWVSALELTTTLFQWLVFFGISFCLKKKSHLGVGAIIALFPRKAQLVVTFFAVIASGLYIFLVAWGGIHLVESLYIAGIDSEDLPIRRWIIALILPLGVIMLGLRLFPILIKIFKGELVSLVANEEDLAKKSKENLEGIM